MPRCLREFAECTPPHRGGCCPPLRCFRQSAYFSQCGTACPRATPPWECAAPRVGVLVGRWGAWPPWAPLFLASLAANPSLSFFLLSDAPPAAALPPNVHFHRLPLAALLERMRISVGVRLRRLSAAGTFKSGVSAAKVNDLKPMWGEAFAADLLRGFDWWGYLQEDVILGNLRALLSASLLARTDVICPFNAPLNSSGVFMLFRNEPRINRIWRRSADAARVLSDPRYIIFDEWWGASKDSMATLLGREAAAGFLRLSTGPARGGASGSPRWMADDKRYARGARGFNDALVGCWRRGELFVNAGREGPPCVGLHPRAASRQVGIFHFSLLKRYPPLGGAPLAAVAAAAGAAAAEEFVITRDGVWLAAEGGRYLLLSGQLGEVVFAVGAAALGAYVLRLSERHAAARCNPKKAACAAPPAAPFPCVAACEVWSNETRGGTAGAEKARARLCRRALSRHKTQMCADTR